MLLTTQQGPSSRLVKLEGAWLDCVVLTATFRSVGFDGEVVEPSRGEALDAAPPHRRGYPAQGCVEPR